MPARPQDRAAGAQPAQSQIPADDRGLAAPAARRRQRDRALHRTADRMSMDQRALLDLACRAARAATVAILEIYGSDFAVRRQDDRTPVTLADERAEAIILAMLRTEAPAIPVIAEEETAAKGAGAAPPVFWLVDPLDGTREFI